MKHLKLFENNNNYTFKDIENIISNFDNLVNYLKPISYWKYLILANNKNYTPEFGSKPSLRAKKDELHFHKVYIIDNIIEIILTWYDHNYYITLNEDEIVQYKLEQYNI